MTEKQLPDGVDKATPKPKPKTGKDAYDPNSGTSKRIANCTESKMQSSAKLKRQAFVREYLYDFNGTQAGLRCGFPKPSAAKKACEWLREPYVQQLIKEYTEGKDEEHLVTRNTILAGLLKEANFAGHNASHAARVAAFSKLGKFLGMEVPQTALIGEVHLHFDSQDEEA